MAVWNRAGGRCMGTCTKHAHPVNPWHPSVQTPLSQADSAARSAALRILGRPTVIHRERAILAEVSDTAAVAVRLAPGWPSVAGAVWIHTSR
eukprot:349842-Chlamydomonas_euryale.AAC.2